MAALAAVENANKVWQRVTKQLAGASPAANEAFKGLKSYLAQQLKDPDLQVVFFSQANTVVASTGTLLGTGTPKVYGIYAKKGLGTTDTYLKVSADATGAGATGTFKFAFPFLAASDEAIYVDPAPTAVTGGLAVMCTTTLIGTTASTGASDGADGFIIYSV